VELAINPIDSALPSGKDIIREERVEGRVVHPPWEQWPSQEGIGEIVHPTMISHGVEISIAGGVEEMVRGRILLLFFSIFLYFYIFIFLF